MDKKNALLLTVIAIATLLVAVVGATFAYFSAQTGGGSSADVTVTTSTSDSMEYGSFSPIVINANQQNFYENAGSHQGTTTGDVKLKANGDATYCYTADLIVAANTLAYASTAEGGRAPAELVLLITKNDTAISTLTGLTTITPLTNHSICTNPTASAPDTPCSNKKTVTVSGFDITGIGEGTINIPGNGTAGSTSVHKITATAGNTTTDSWEATVTLINLATDQNYNTSKTFTASLKFTTVDCTTGAPTAEEERDLPIPPSNP